jgi:hypothetical protein
MRRVYRFADGVTALLGCWALYSWAAVYLGLDFHQLLLGLPLPIVAAGALVRVAPVPSFLEVRDTPTAPTPAWLAPTTLAVAVVGLFGWWWGIVPLPVSGALAVLHLATLLPASRTQVMPAPELTTADLIAMAVAGVAAVLATLVLNRPDIDDAYYFSAILGTLAHPDRPVLSFDTMYGEPGAPIHHLIHRPQTFELLAAAVSRIPGLDAAHTYYVVLPIAFAALTVLAGWLVLTRIAPRSAGPAVLLLVALLLAWGEGHRTWGNYAFVRLYQGKAVFVCALAPMIVHQAFAFCRQATPARWMLLACATAAAASVTSCALIIAPVVAGLALLGAAPLTRPGLLRTLVGLAATTPPLLILVLAKWELSHEGLLITGDDIRALNAVTGNGVRGPLALSLALGLPCLLHLARSPAAAGTTRWVGATFLLVLNGISAPLLGDAIAAILSWRFYWAALVPILAAGSLSVAGHLTWDTIARLSPREKGVGTAGPENPRAPREAVALAGFALAAGIAFFAFGRWTPDPSNRVSFHFAEPKRPEAIWALAREVVERAPPGSAVLAPARVACWLTGFDAGPRLIAVRPLYTNDLRRFWGDEESAIRQDLQDFAEGNASVVQTARALTAIDERCIGVIVTASKARKRPFVHKVLHHLGFTREKWRGYDLWTREPPFPGCQTP